MEEIEIIRNKIHNIRNTNVMMDFELAELYGVPTKVLKQAVKRNIERFPEDFMFVLNPDEWKAYKEEVTNCDLLVKFSNTAASAFTEQGVAMLSSVLRSPKAIAVNITIMRAFAALRRFAFSYAEINSKLYEFMRTTDMKFDEVFRALAEMSEQKRLSEKPRKMIGYKRYDEQKTEGDEEVTNCDLLQSNSKQQPAPLRDELVTICDQFQLSDNQQAITNCDHPVSINNLPK